MASEKRGPEAIEWIEGMAPDEGVPVDLVKAFAELESSDDDGDEDDAQALLTDALMARFIASPESEPLELIKFSRPMLQYAVADFGVTIATLTSAQLREIVFETIPHRLPVQASTAGAILGELRAFFAFAKRELGLAQADELLAALGGEATTRLTRALSDPRNFGRAKSIMMAGWDAGFDVSTADGLEAWMSEVDKMPLPLSIYLPPFARLPARAVDPEAERARKNKRKAERKARKKNR